MSCRLIYAGTPDFAVPALSALAAAGHDICLVLTQPDRPAGRGRRPQPSAVKQAALELGLEVAQPATLKEGEIRQQLARRQAELMVVAAYGLLLPAAVLEIPRHGCWNIHASLLPRWRGAAPIQRAIEAGDAESGISIMQMDVGLDTGDVLSRHPVTLAADETGGSLHDRLALLGAEAIAAQVARLDRGEPLSPQPQDSDAATYAPKLSKQEAEIDWRHPVATVERRIRAFNPWPVAWTESLFGERLRVWQARPAAEACDETTAGNTAGKLAAGACRITDDRRLLVGCADGALELLTVQRAGRGRVSAADFLNAVDAG